jgi:hypothetical protein
MHDETHIDLLRFVESDVSEYEHDKERHEQREKERLPVSQEHFQSDFGQHPCCVHSN